MCKTTEALAMNAANCCRMGCTAFLGMVLYSNEATNSVTYDQTDTTVANKKLILFDQTLTSEYDALSDNNSPHSIGNRLDVAKDWFQPRPSQNVTRTFNFNPVHRIVQLRRPFRHRQERYKSKCHRRRHLGSLSRGLQCGIWKWRCRYLRHWSISPKMFWSCQALRGPC